MKCHFTIIKYHLFLFACLVLSSNFLFSQNPIDSSKGTILKSCSPEENSILYNLGKEQQRLSSKLSELQARQNKFEVERDAHEKIPPDLLAEAEDLKHRGDVLNKEIKELRKKIIKASQIIEKKYYNNYFGTVRYIGNSNIESDKKIFANVSALNGDFNLNSDIKGDLAVINGTLYIAKTVKVEGKIILINGKIISESPNESSLNAICGDIGPYDEPYNEFSSENQYSFDISAPQFQFPGVDFTNGGVIRYNKVEGFFIGMEVPKRFYWSGKHHNAIYGSIGYGFANHSWEGKINFDKWFGNENRTEFGGEYHNMVDSKDNWRINSEENSLAAIFFHEDFKDYYKKSGWSVHLAQYFDKNFRFKVELIEDDYKSINNNTEWSLFSKDKFFRSNPSIDPGKIRSVILGFDHITVYGKDYIPTGWNISAQYEIGQGDYEFFREKQDFNRFTLDIRRYQKLAEDCRVNARFILGSSEKYLPVQRTFELGGLGTIPSLNFKEFEGNRMILFNAEVLFNISHGEEFIPFVFNGNDLIVFYDAGFIDQVSNNLKIDQGFDQFSLNGLKQDIGVAISFWRGSFRIGATFRLDKNESAKLFLRLAQPF